MASILHSPLARVRLIGLIAFVSAVVLIFTPSVLPWSWGFAAYWFCLGLGLEAICRKRSGSLPPLLIPFVIAIATNVAARVFYRGESSWLATVYQTAVMSVSMGVGILVAHIPWPGGRNGKPSGESMQPTIGAG